MGHWDRSIFRNGSLAAAIACALAATGAAAARVAHRASSTTLSSEKVKLGKVIDTSGGRALYMFTRDSRGRSSCSGRCAAAWPPLIASGRVVVARGSGLNPKLVGKTRRSDGRLQVTYDHHPLYMFSGDRGRGQTKGEGAHAFGGSWYLVSPSGRAVKPRSGGVCRPLCPGY
jgi:predicted lipoprotein with Yx(FWY)xxD motif